LREQPQQLRDRTKHTPLLPIPLLALPIARRFRFHFETKRETNQREKPEWYFAFILNTIRDHTLFLSNDLQPILNDQGLSAIDVKYEFMREMLSFGERKLLRELPHLLHEPRLFTHTINEALTFEATLRQVHGYPSEAPGCLKVLTDNPQVFDEWVNMEFACKSARIEPLLPPPKKKQEDSNDSPSSKSLRANSRRSSTRQRRGTLSTKE